MLKSHTLVVGPFQCNCTVLICEKTKEAMVIDAGDEFSKIQKYCLAQGIDLKYSVHTHAHLDHIGAVGDLKAWSSKTKICLHRSDLEIYNALPLQGQYFGFHYETPPPVDYFLNDQERLRVGEYEFEVVHTPGHSPAGVCLRFKEGAVDHELPFLFSGDTLFESSIGRTDLWGGDHRQLIKSIKERLFILDDQTIVSPGHGARTSIGFEASQNPFLK
jgi:glyoxylase-like metal-dependent hydrolase (beta-lactamase superfamily II)